jgi:DNA-binding NarL/FixJ family response regulator
VIGVLVVNQLALMCDVIAAVLEDEPDIRVVGCATALDQAPQRASECDVLLVSTGLPDSAALPCRPKNGPLALPR